MADSPDDEDDVDDVVPDVDRIQRAGEIALVATMALVYGHALEPIPVILPVEFLYTLAGLIVALVGARSLSKRSLGDEG